MTPNLGTFGPDPQTEWLSEPPDRLMRLLRDFWYDDPDGRRWLAPAGGITDGASIPAPLWSSIGSPFTGPYRRAAIVHDAAVDAPGVPRLDADHMFYQACLAGGCAPSQAELLYAGVRIGAWLPRVRLWTSSLAAQPLAAARSLSLAAEPGPTPLLASRPALEPTLAGESMRLTLREIAADLAARPAADQSFATLAAVVERHLAAKASQ